MLKSPQQQPYTRFVLGFFTNNALEHRRLEGLSDPVEMRFRPYSLFNIRNV